MRYPRSKVSTVSLPGGLYYNQRAVVAGFGLTHEGLPRKLKKLSVITMTATACKYRGVNINDRDDFMCAQHVRGEGHGICKVRENFVTIRITSIFFSEI